MTSCDPPLRAPRKPWWPYSEGVPPDAQPGAPALELRELRVRYPQATRSAIQDVSLTLACGERAALVGPNGAGKSTILRTVAGLLSPESGSIRMFGNPAGDSRYHLAYLPQRAHLDWQFPITVSDFVMTGRYIRLGWFRRPGKVDRDHVDGALRRLGIATLREHPIGDLSGGQQQRALLARALVQEARLFLLDEPLNALDEATRDLVEELLADHALQGGSVLAATHDHGRLSESFDIAIQMRQGTIDRLRRWNERTADIQPARYAARPRAAT